MIKNNLIMEITKLICLECKKVNCLHDSSTKIEHRVEYSIYGESSTYIPIGTPVKFDKGKIRPVLSGEIPFGIVVDKASYIDKNIQRVRSNSATSRSLLKIGDRRSLNITESTKKSDDSESGTKWIARRPSLGSSQIFETNKFGNIVAILGIVKIIKGSSINEKWIKIDVDYSDTFELYFIY